jgi:predicted metal-dependent peptidase
MNTTTINIQKIVDKVSKACKSLMFKEPFYGLFLVGMNKQYKMTLPTAGVSALGMGVQLAINPEFFDGLTEKQQMGLLKHEILHVSFGHLIMKDRFEDMRLFNVAADLEINQYIDFEALPEGGLTLETFPELKLPERAGTKVYYDILDQAREDGTCPTLDNILGNMDGSSPYCHPTWEEFDELSEADKKLVQKQIEHQLKETAEATEKRCGSIPGELADIIARLNKIEPPSFNWKQYLRRFVGNSSIIYTKKLRRKYNKRYTGNPGLKIKYKNHICVGVDTSGSVSNAELVEFMSELTHMHKTGHKITVVQCDTSINSIEEFNPKKDWDIKGRGGTCFQPVVDHYNEKGYYTALIYLTDGEAYTPENCPKNALWVHSTQCEINEDLPGLKIQINNIKEN